MEAPKPCTRGRGALEFEDDLYLANNSSFFSKKIKNKK
jgi:hypothetical protein